MCFDSVFDRRSFLLGGLVAFPASARCSAALAMPGQERPLRVEAFRLPDATDRTTISRALSAWATQGGPLEFEADKTYDLGRLGESGPVFALSGVQNGTIIGNGAKIIAETTAPVAPTIFFFQSFRNVRVSGLRGHDRGADISRDWQGMRFIVADSSLGVCEGIELDDIHVENAVALFAAQGIGPRISGITLRNVTAIRCYYGINCIENGDDLTADFAAIDCRRAYFVYGVSRHSVAIDIRQDKGAIGAQASCLIKRYRRDTTDIRLRARFAGVLAWQDLVKLEQQPVSGTGRIARISVSLTVDRRAIDQGRASRLALSSISPTGPAATSNDIWTDIALDGDLGPSGGLALHSRTRPVRRTIVYLSPSTRGTLTSMAKGVTIRHGFAPNQPVLPRKL